MAILHRCLSQTGCREGKTWLELLIEALLGEAGAGNCRAIREVFDRIAGPPGAARPAPPLEIDDATARRILGIIGDDHEDPGDD